MPLKATGKYRRCILSFYKYIMEVIDSQQTEKRVLPNSNATLVLGILSLILGCGTIGLILGIIGLVISKEGKQLYENNSDAYTGFGNLHAGRVLCIIGIIFGGISTFIGLLWLMGFATLFGALSGLGM